MDWVDKFYNCGVYSLLRATPALAYRIATEPRRAWGNEAPLGLEGRLEGPDDVHDLAVLAAELEVAHLRASSEEPASSARAEEAPVEGDTPGRAARNSPLGSCT